MERLDQGGMILGVMETTIPYERGTVSSAAGDRLVLFTDGCREAMNREVEEYGEERLAGVIARCAGCGARMTVDRSMRTSWRTPRGRCNRTTSP